MRRLRFQLAARGNGTRESGAFLLGRVKARPLANEPWAVHRVVYYDDLDADCLTGGITFSRFDELWGECKRDGSTVIADIHTHPSGWVQQSAIDSNNPMISTIGHVAIIVPHFSVGQAPIRSFGVYRYLGGLEWQPDPRALLVRGWLGRRIEYLIAAIRGLTS